MMKIISILCSLIVLFFISISLAAYSYWDGQTMSADEVKAKWGVQLQDLKKFKDSNYEIKSQMAYQIMTDKSLIGKSYEQIRQLFGENDGYFFSDTIPTYIVQRGKNRSEETWQLVFRMETNKVKEIFMQKNCCD